MIVAAITCARRDRTCGDLGALRDSISRWLTRRRDRDCDADGAYVGRHKTQLQAIESVLAGVAAALARDLDTIDLNGDAGELYGRCRDLDVAIVWLQRFWEFFRDKFDQRDEGDGVGPIVRAADEVVWSCYHEVMALASARDSTVEHGAAPLAYLAPEFSPAALDAERPIEVPSLRLDVRLPGWGEPEKELVDSLPVPLVRLPPWCVRSPWWLVHIAHEVGHHVYARLNLKAHVQGGVRAAANTVLTDTDAARWGAWAEEVFADAFGVLMMGSAAVSGIADVERTSAAAMVLARDGYPPPAVRLALLAEAAGRLETFDGRALGGIDPVAAAAPDPKTARHLAAVAPVVTFLFEADLPRGLGTLRELCAAQEAQWKAHTGNVAMWMAQLNEPAPGVHNPTIGTARHLCAAAVASWQEAAAIDDGAVRSTRMQQLAAATVRTLLRSGPPGTRATDQPDADEHARGERIGAALLEGVRKRREFRPRGDADGVQD